MEEYRTPILYKFVDFLEWLFEFITKKVHDMGQACDVHCIWEQCVKHAFECFLHVGSIISVHNYDVVELNLKICQCVHDCLSDTCVVGGLEEAGVK